MSGRKEYKMEKYQYHPELKGPGFGVDITNDGPLMRLFICWNTLVNNILCSGWNAPKGVKKSRVAIQVRDSAEITAWLLEPEGNSGRLPVMLYCHGGAFFMPIMPSSLALAAHYVQKLGCRVVMPQYRLTPKHPYPTPLDDCCDTLDCLIRQADAWKLDPDQLIIYGESAGGCLAAEVMHRCRDNVLAKPVGQMLIYPVTDCSGDYPSLTKYQFASWSQKANETMWKLYLPRFWVGETGDAVPMERENFKNFPLTYIEAAEIDTLCDQGIAYAEKMRQSGVKVLSETVPGAYHGFDGEMDSPLVQRVLARRVEVLRQMLRR